MDREDVKMLVKKWWDIYDDETLIIYKTTLAANVPITESNLVAQDIADKEKSGLRPMVTGVLEVPAAS